MKAPLTFVSKPWNHVSTSALPNWLGLDICPALLTRISIGPNSFFVASNAEVTAVGEVMSATKVRTLRPGNLPSREALVERREEAVRPRMVILVVPERAKAWPR